MMPEIEFSKGRAICMLVFSGFTQTSIPTMFWMSPVINPTRMLALSFRHHSKTGSCRPGCPRAQCSDLAPNEPDCRCAVASSHCG